MTDQKPNCLSCPSIPNCEYSHETGQPACINHPGAREWLMRDVVKELDRITTLELTEEQECYIDGIREAIALIRGVKE